MSISVRSAIMVTLLAALSPIRIVRADTGCTPPPAAEPPVGISSFFWNVAGGGPYPVLGSDDRAHLAYVLVLTNGARTRGTLEGIVPVDPEQAYAPTGTSAMRDQYGADRTGQMTYVFSKPADGDDIAGEQPLPPGQFFTTLPRGGAGTMLMDVTYPSLAAVPRYLSHRLTMRFPTKDGGTRTETATGSPVPVSCTPPIVLHSPLRGERWWNANGCCDTYASHRGANFPVNGSLVPTQQFAIDWLQVRPDGSCCTGDPHLLSSWPHYGSVIYAAGAGTVIETANDLPDQVPAEPPKGITLETVLGNHVIIDMGGSRYAFYAHLRPGSVPIGIVPGAKVAAGDVIGLLGNSGNTDAPHLHFHVMDKPHVFQGTSIPFVIDDMDYEGRPDGTFDSAIDTYMEGKPIRLDTAGARQLHERMPLTNSVFGFR